MSFIISAHDSAHQTAGARCTCAGLVYFLSCSRFWVLGSLCGASVVPFGVDVFRSAHQTASARYTMCWVGVLSVLLWVLGFLYGWFFRTPVSVHFRMPTRLQVPDTTVLG